MCGIAGMLSLRRGPLERPELVGAMMDRLTHRGPDDAGEYRSPDGAAVLGHRRLRVIDLDTGRQPLSNEDGSVWVSFNGEIYDFQRLADALRARGHRFRTKTDTEVIVHLYEDSGAGCLASLMGMMALALWDQKAQTLLLARDRMGKKPLYYTKQAGVLYFASELDALLVVPGLSRDLDERALDLYLTLGYIPAPWTIYREARKLPAGHAVIAHAARDEEPVAFDYASERTREPSILTWSEAKYQLLVRLREATRRRMVSDVPLGCFLSGGVDSSAVLSCMAELTSKPVKTFSIGFAEEGFSELEYARMAARQFGTDHHEYVLEPEGIDVLDDLVRHFGEPFGDSSALATWYLSKLTRKSVTVALTGDGGDELFGGYLWYRTARRLALQSRLVPRPLAKTLARWQRSRDPWLGRIGKRAEFLALPEAQRYARQRELLTPALKADLYTPAFAAQSASAAWEWLAAQYERANEADALNRAMRADLATYMADDLLVKVDRTSMAHALECRSPLLDVELADWALQLPSAFKVNARVGKRLLRDAVEDRFPPGFLNRPKQGFTVPLERWFAADLRTIVEDRVVHGPLKRLDRLSMPVVGALVHDHFSGRANHASVVWSLLVLASWMERDV